MSPAQDPCFLLYLRLLQLADRKDQILLDDIQSILEEYPACAAFYIEDNTLCIHIKDHFPLVFSIRRKRNAHMPEWIGKAGRFIGSETLKAAVREVFAKLFKDFEFPDIPGF